MDKLLAATVDRYGHTGLSEIEWRDVSVTKADEVRAYCAAQIVEPARAQGVTEVAIRVGDVHRAMGYENRLPLVCSALGANMFEETYRVRRTAVEGPLNGANTVLRFTVLPGPR